MAKFRKGDVCRVTGGGYNHHAVGTRVFVNEESNVPSLHDANGEYVGCIDEDSLTLLTGTDAAVRGSVVVDKEGEARTVLGVCGEVLALSYYDDQESLGSFSSYHDLKREGCTLKGSSTKRPGYAYDDQGRELGAVRDGKIIA